MSPLRSPRSPTTQAVELNVLETFTWALEDRKLFFSLDVVFFFGDWLEKLQSRKIWASDEEKHLSSAPDRAFHRYKNNLEA